MARILWIGTSTEIEPDILEDCLGVGIDIEVWNVVGDGARLRPHPRIRHVPMGAELVHMVERATFDLAVMRYPYYLSDADRVQLRDLPVVAWSSEQGPTISEAMATSVGFTRIAVNHRADLPAYRARFPDAKLFVLPFGCAKREPVAAPVDRDLLADGKCHYGCTFCGGTIKRRSVETVVIPAIEDARSLSLYGESPVDCGWLQVPGARPHYRGYFPPENAANIYARHRVYLGISWNWGHSGYGVKLARVLSAGLPVIWHRTPGMGKDGLIEGTHLVCTSTPAETRLRIDELLSSDDYCYTLSEQGRAFALREWRWSTNLLRLLHEVGTVQRAVHPTAPVHAPPSMGVPRVRKAQMSPVALQDAQPATRVRRPPSMQSVRRRTTKMSPSSLKRS